MNNKTEINKLLAEIKSGSGDLVAQTEKLHKLLSQHEKQDGHVPRCEEDWHNAARLGCLVGVSDMSQEDANENALGIGLAVTFEAYNPDLRRPFRAGGATWRYAAIARRPNHPVLWCGGDEPKELIGKHITVYLYDGDSCSFQAYEEGSLLWGRNGVDFYIIGYIVHELPERGDG